MKGNATIRATAVVAVPSVGGNVQVRRIPPKLLRDIHAKATKGGKLDLQELMVWKLVYGMREPNLTEAEVREITRRYSMRTLGPIIDKIDELSGTDEHLRNVDGPRQVRKFVEPVVMATAWMERFPTERPTTAKRPRARGAGRPKVHSSARRSSERSGDSGSDDGPSDESEPPRRRLCAFCNRELPPRKRKYCTDLHADRDRQRRKRERDRARDLTPKIPTTADFVKMTRLEPGELERLLRKATCACNGHHLLDAPRDPDLGERCCKCGRQRPESASGRRLLGQLAALREAARS